MLTFVMTQLQLPISNHRIRRALLRAVDQKDFVFAVAGADPSNCRTGIGLFPPGAPMASEAGLEVLRGAHDMNLVRQEIVQAGYSGERTVVNSWADDFANRASSEVGAEMMRKVGLNVDFQSMDTGTALQRLENKGPVNQGGWSCYFPDWVGLSLRDPAANPYARGIGARGRRGWATSTRLEELREAWFAAPDLAMQQRIAAEIQVQALLTDVTIIPLGLFYDLIAYRTELTGVLPGWPTVFWNARRLS
jgi:peptide/nickel transport system substrate-binding protein